MKISSFLFLFITPLLLSACSTSSPDLNLPLSSNRISNTPKNDRSDDLTLMMTFSGGGTRSAALSYGVLEKLRDTKITINNKQRRLLDEIDLISSVSGGSFTSAYYGLFGDQIFEDFESKFLKHRVQNALLKRSVLNPKAWIRLARGLFDRSDLAAEYYNQILFKEKTFSDMRTDAPTIVINATDLSLGQGFSFTGYHFNWICSDLGSYPVSRAVAASSAVPILFSPITLENHAGSCDASPIVWKIQQKNKKARNKQKKITEKRYLQSLEVKKYRDDENLKYLHLVDGGVADNLGIRSILNIVSFHKNNMWNAMKNYRMDKSKKVVFISVNAHSFINKELSKQRATPSTINVLDTATTIQSRNFNNETYDLLRSKFPLWKQQVQTARCKEKPSKDCADIDFEIIEISLGNLNPNELKELGDIPTALELPSDSIDKLKAAGKNLVDRSPAFKQLLRQF